MNLTKAFEQILQVSILSSFLALGILIIKLIFKQKLSAKLHYFLWFILLIRLLIPFNLENPLSRLNFNPLQQQKFDISAIIEQNSLNTSALNSADTNIQGSDTSKYNDKSSIVLTKDKIFNFGTAAFIWIIGALAIFSYFLTINLILLQKLRRSPICEKHEIIKILEDSKERLKVKSKITVIYDTDIKSPAVYGFLKPKILISSQVMGSLTEEQLKFVFLHEIAHIKRKDLFMNIVVMLIQIVYWFNPLVLYTLYKFKQDCEIACDAAVLEKLTSEDTKKYGHTIISMLQIISESHWIPGTLGFASKYNNRRVIMIKLFKKTSLKWAVLALSLTILAGCSSLSNSLGNNNNSNTNQNNTVTNNSPSSTVNNSSTSSNAVASNSSSNSSKTSSSTTSSVSPQNEAQKVLLANIKKLALQGKVINCEFAANTGILENVMKKWGNPDRTDWVPAAKGTYATYSKYNMVFGFNKGQQIFEVRTFDKSLKTLSLSMVKQTYGTPQYDVKTNGQEIIGYTAGKDYKILMVFPQPTKKTPNPFMDHYSVLYPRGTVNMMADDPGRQW